MTIKLIHSDIKDGVARIHQRRRIERDGCYVYQDRIVSNSGETVFTGQWFQTNRTEKGRKRGKSQYD